MKSKVVMLSFVIVQGALAEPALRSNVVRVRPMRSFVSDPKRPEPPAGGGHGPGGNKPVPPRPLGIRPESDANRRREPKTVRSTQLVILNALVADRPEVKSLNGTVTQIVLVPSDKGTAVEVRVRVGNETKIVHLSAEQLAGESMFLPRVRERHVVYREFAGKYEGITDTATETLRDLVIDSIKLKMEHEGKSEELRALYGNAGLIQWIKVVYENGSYVLVVKHAYEEEPVRLPVSKDGLDNLKKRGIDLVKLDKTTPTLYVSDVTMHPAQIVGDKTHDDLRALQNSSMVKAGEGQPFSLYFGVDQFTGVPTTDPSAPKYAVALRATPITVEGRTRHVWSIQTGEGDYPNLGQEHKEVLELFVRAWGQQ